MSPTDKEIINKKLIEVNKLLQEKLIELDKLVQEKLANLLNIQLSMTMLLLGIIIGVIGNLFASYIIEFHLLIMGENTFWGLLLGIIVFGVVLKFSTRSFKKDLEPLEIAISKMKATQEMIIKERKTLNTNSDAS